MAQLRYGGDVREFATIEGFRHVPSSRSSPRILCPNGHLGFAPIKTGSFRIGLDCAPDLICADTGSCDVGPGPLGADVSSSPVRWQRHDLEHMLLAARRLGVPMIVGSAGDTGSNSGVDRFVGIIEDLAREHRLARFRIGYFYSEVGKEYLRRKITTGDAIDGLDGRPPLDLATLGALPTASWRWLGAPLYRIAGPGCRRHHRRPQRKYRRGNRLGPAIGGRTLRPGGLCAALHRLWPRRHSRRARAAQALPRPRALRCRAGDRADARDGRGGVHDRHPPNVLCAPPAVKGTAGGVAFLLDKVMPASPAYRWTVNHTVRLDDPLELFPTFITEAGV